ncbi:FxsA family membrane protein [Streptomyces sp. NPDC056061]|uniref:FxsA family membrane protein n=1 Tax=Streptomyces sp. NPDC056061 TaxID=3345700 RepID=UPI0035DEB66B
MTTGTPPPTARRRSRARTFVPLAVAAWAVLEIWLLTVIADAAGGFTVLLLLVAGIVLGAAVVKRAGRRAFRNLTETLQRMPGQPGAAAEPAAASSGGGNGFLMLGGLLLMIPGPVSDVAGLLLLMPWVRSALGRYAERTLDRQMRAAPPGSFSDAFQQARIHRPDGKIVQGEVVREEGVQQDSRPGDGPRPPLTP